MQYMLLIYGDPTAEAPPVAPDGVYADFETATRVLRDDGVLVAGDPLAGIDTATTIRARGRDRLVTDGPFAETKEQLLGFYVVEVPDIDAAIGYAGRMPNVPWGSVEVRPIPEPGPASARAIEG